jgi:hypothetical protein
MPAKFNYASILHAVGQVLDQLGVKSFAIQEEEDGLLVEGYNGDGQIQVQIRYDIASLYELLNTSSEERVEATSPSETPGLLRQFLASHHRELVEIAL